MPALKVRCRAASRTGSHGQEPMFTIGCFRNATLELRKVDD
jgi:hypothetical protein